MGFFPVDKETLAYLEFTGRSLEHIALVEAYCKEQYLFRTDSRQTQPSATHWSWISEALKPRWRDRNGRKIALR